MVREVRVFGGSLTEKFGLSKWCGVCFLIFSVISEPSEGEEVGKVVKVKRVIRGLAGGVSFFRALSLGR